MYFITTIEHLPKDYSIPGSRCVGYYSNFEDANCAVRSNFGDIHEYLYDYCVIEKVEEGIYKYALKEERWFYKFNGNTREYEYIDEPEEFAHQCGFGIG